MIQREGDGLGQRKWDARESNGSRSVQDTKDWEEMCPGLLKSSLSCKIMPAFVSSSFFFFKFSIK